MKKNKMFASLLLAAVLLSALVLVTGALASSGSAANILDVQIVDQSVVIKAEVPCAYLAQAETAINSTSIRVNVYSVPNPLAGVCEDGAPPVVQTLTINVSLSQAKDVYVLHGKMYP